MYPSENLNKTIITARLANQR